MCNKTKCKIKKNTFADTIYNFCYEKALAEHRGICLKINGKQSVKLRSGSNKFQKYFKQLAVSCKIYADFECNVKKNRSNNRKDNTSYTEKYQVHIPCSSACKLVWIDKKFSKTVVLYRGKNVVDGFIETIQ